MTPADAGDAGSCLYQVWEELTVRGLAVGQLVIHGICQCFFGGLDGAYAEMDLMADGALVWVYLPSPRTGITPHQAASMVLALLTSGPVPGSLPPADPGLALKDAAGQLLTACGMSARPARIRYDDEVYTEVVVTSPAAPGRGHVRISDEGTIRWECRFAAGGDPAGLPAPEVAQAIDAALAGHLAASSGPGRDAADRT